MRIDYNSAEDILFISFNDEPISKDITYDWNINVGLTEHGIGQITILDAKATGMVPLVIPKTVLEQAVKTIN
jgi:uncharacterized protein YuzE